MLVADGVTATGILEARIGIRKGRGCVGVDKTGGGSRQMQMGQGTVSMDGKN